MPIFDEVGEDDSSTRIQLRKRGDSAIIRDNENIPEEFRQQKLTIDTANETLIVGMKNDLVSVRDYFLGNPYLLCFLILSLWVSIGIIFYQFKNQWTTATSFYFAVEGGLSVGYCYPSEVDDRSKLFTIFYVMTASSIVSGFLGLTLSTIFAQKIHLVPAEHGINAIKLRNEMDELTIQSVWRYLWYHGKYFIGWYHHRFLTIMTLLFIFWMGVGVIYGMLQEKYSFISALYWAITTCATGGLQIPQCDNDSVDDAGINCNMGDFRGTIMGIYMLIGVPIYAVTISQYARLFLTPIVIQREWALMDRPIEDAQFLFAANVLSPEGSETLVLGEYILLELLRLGLVDQERIELFKKKFYELDVQQNGELEFSDLHAIGKIIPRKIHSIDVAKRIRNRSLEFLYRNITSPAGRAFGSNSAFFSPPRPDRSGDATNHHENGNTTTAPSAPSFTRFLPRGNSAREFFSQFSGPRKDSKKGNQQDPSSNHEEEDIDVIVLPPKAMNQRRRPGQGKKAFRKSLRHSITENVEEIPHLIREHLQSADRSRLASEGEYSPVRARGEVIALEDHHRRLVPINGEYSPVAGSFSQSSGVPTSPLREKYRQYMATLFDDFDYNIDDENAKQQQLQLQPPQEETEQFQVTQKPEKSEIEKQLALLDSDSEGDDTTKQEKAIENDNRRGNISLSLLKDRVFSEEGKGKEQEEQEEQEENCRFPLPNGVDRINNNINNTHHASSYHNNSRSHNEGMDLDLIPPPYDFDRINSIDI